MNPTANATGTRLTVEASKLFGHATIQLRVERRSGRDARQLSRARPAPGEPPEHQRAEPGTDERQHPREQVEPVLRRLREDRRPELQDELVLDLALRVAGGDARG